LASFGFIPVQTGDAAPEAGVVLPLLDSAETNVTQLEEVVGRPSRGGGSRSSTGDG
jgi:hypothetical protein